jgi:hypothetical protein
VTVLVTTSLICRTLLAEDLVALQSCEYRALRAASQSNGDRTDLALNGDLAVALMGESSVDMAGDGGMCKLGNDVTPVGGADMGCLENGLGGTPTGDLVLLAWFPHLHEQSVCSLLAVDGTDSWAASSSSSLELLPARFSGMTGEVTDMALRKSMYAVGGLMGVLVYSSLMKSGTAERGVLADRAESSEGKVAVTGVVNCGSLGLVAGMLGGGDLASLV